MSNEIFTDLTKERLVNKIVQELKNYASEKCAAFSKKMIKEEDGYKHSTSFIGCKSGTIKYMVKKFQNIVSLQDIVTLIRSEYFETRSLALNIMVSHFQKKLSVISKEEIVKIYLNNTEYINNWALVDISAYHIVGAFFKPEAKIFQYLTESKSLWENRIAIVATLAYIKQNKFELTLSLCQKYLDHPHHLIHKACGWMLREIGKRDQNLLITFLRNNHLKMPRIMLSYAREKIKNIPLSL